MSYELPVGRAVKAFMDLMGQDVPMRPDLPDEDVWALRLSLIDEEYRELRTAYENEDYPEFLDACVDLVYVVVGAAISAGMPFDKAFKEVHRANMAKATTCPKCNGNKWGTLQRWCEECEGLGRLVVRREDGKILKPVDWQPPNITKIIEEAAGVEGV